MRRSDREVTDFSNLEQIIQQCDVCRLGLSENNTPYVVPLNFGYEINDGRLTLFFHCAKEGKKLNILQVNPNVCFEMDCRHELVEKENACSYSMKYESIIGNGKAEILFNMQEKNKALSKIMEKYTHRTDFQFDPGMVEKITVFQVVSQDFTGKSHT